MTLPKHLPRFHFGLRALLLAMFGVALVFAWVHRARDQSAAIHRLCTSNAAVGLLYDFEIDGSGGLTHSREPGPEWLRRQIGIDYLSSIAGVHLIYPTDVELVCLTKFPKLRRVLLQRSVDLTDEGMTHLAKLTSLKTLVIGEADQVTDSGLLQLANLKNLTELRLDCGRRMTPAGIQQLQQRLPNCRIEVRGQAERDELAARN